MGFELFHFILNTKQFAANRLNDKQTEQDTKMNLEYSQQSNTKSGWLMGLRE